VLAQTNRISTGFQSLDQHLDGGWPLGSVVEILYEHEGIGEFTLLLPVLASLTRQDRWIVLVGPPYIPYPPALSAGSIQLSRVLLIENVCREEVLWAVEQSLQSPACGAVLFWAAPYRYAHWRRLQRAAEQGGGLAVWLHGDRDQQAFAPALRLALAVDPQHLLSVQILKRRGGWPAGPILLRPDVASCQS